MLFLDNRLVDQTEQMFRRIRGCLEEKQKKQTSDYNRRALLF